MDSHNAPVNINIIQLLKQNEIVCVMLPPHCAQDLQPIDAILHKAHPPTQSWSKFLKLFYHCI